MTKPMSEFDVAQAVKLAEAVVADPRTDMELLSALGPMAVSRRILARALLTVKPDALPSLEEREGILREAEEGWKR